MTLARRIAQLVCLAASLDACLGGGVLPAQSTLPATRPTSPISPTSPAVVGGASGGSAVAGGTASPAAASPLSVRHSAEVKYVDGQLEVQADNSSLNQILRDIGRAIGTTISGGVEEQRVYGHYGPGAPAAIVATLLEGSGSNMLLQEATTSTPGNLILTPRQGGPTPPNPSVQTVDQDAQTSDQPARRGYQPSFAIEPAIPATQGMGGTTTSSSPVPEAAPDAAPGAASSEGGTPAGGQNPASPNGVRTPEQIYQQLQQLQRAQPQR